MNDLKQWIKKILVIAGVLAVAQVLVMVLMYGVPMLTGEEGCSGAGLACPKDRGITLKDVEYAQSLEELGDYYGWDYLIFGCGWSRLLNEAVGCQYEKMESNWVLSPEDYNFISWGGEMQSGRLVENVPLIRFSFGDTYGELVFPCAGYTCEYGNIGCAGCYNCGVYGFLPEDGE